MTKWDLRFLDLASHVATWSKDPSTKVGAIIVDHDRRVVGLGYNGFPRFVGDQPERYADRSVKYRLVVHAEANAILNALLPVRGYSLYVTKFPCSECAKLVIQSGISSIVAPVPATEGMWAEDANFSLQMLQEATVALKYADS